MPFVFDNMKDSIIRTEILNGNSNLNNAAEILHSGGIVAFPTETVYGIGAAISNMEAVIKIFQIKRRPLNNPLAAHISDLKQVEELCLEIPDAFYKLAEKFLPGALSIVLKKNSTVNPIITANLDTIGIRFPDDLTALRLISLLGEPIAATSANISGNPPFTSAKDILIEFNGQIDAVVDDGISRLGIASTVISLATETPFLIRKGAIDIQEIEEVLGCKLKY